jgi:branched-chain amino acid transport system substrate-binding protein
MMKLSIRFLNLAVMLGGLLLPASQLRAQGVSGDVIKIGIMNDQTGPYSDNCGPGAVAAARLAVGDFGGAVNGKKIEFVTADDQNKPDIGVAIALRWLDNEGVDAIVGCSASSIALAVQDIM